MTYHQKLNTLQINLLCETQLNVPHKCIDFQAIVALINEVVPRKLDRIIALNGILTNRHALTVRAMDYEVSKSKWTKEYELLPATYITRPIQEHDGIFHVLPYGTPCFTFMDDGRVLVALGNDKMQDLRAYIFDPRPRPNMEDGTAAGPSRFQPVSTEVESSYLCRMDASLVTLHDGRILRLGGWIRGAPFAKNAAYDQSIKKWSRFEEDITFPSAAVCIVLGTGDVLVCGGFLDPRTGEVLKTAYLYRTASRKYERTGDMSDARAWHGGCLLQNGNVFVCGGTSKIAGPKDGVPEVILEPAVYPVPAHVIPATDTEPERRVAEVRGKPARKIPAIPPETYRGDRSALVEGADEYHVGTGKWVRLSLSNRFESERPQCILMDDGSVFIMSDMEATYDTLIYHPVSKKISEGPKTNIKYGGFIAIPVYK
jgi:hypothetical protein